MIIDIHTHLCDYDGVAKPFWDGWAEVSALRVVCCWRLIGVWLATLVTSS